MSLRLDILINTTFVERKQGKDVATDYVAQSRGISLPFAFTTAAALSGIAATIFRMTVAGIAIAVRRSLALNSSTLSSGFAFCADMRFSTSVHTEKSRGIKSGEYFGNGNGTMRNSFFASMALLHLYLLRTKKGYDTSNYASTTKRIECFVHVTCSM